MKAIPDFSFVESIGHIGRRDAINILQLSKERATYGGFQSTVPNHFDGT
jgi:hypothetical protein